MNRTTLIHYQATLWPAVCAAQKWSPKDEVRRRDARAVCWESIGLVGKGEGMPGDDAETTALFTYLRHLADPNNITRDMEWDKCRADYVAYNTSRRADWWETRGFGPKGSRRLRQNRFDNRRSAQGTAIEDPLPRDEANQRLWKMRQKTRSREKRGLGREGCPQPSEATEPTIPDDLIPF